MMIKNRSNKITSSNEDCHDDSTEDKMCLAVHDKNNINQ